MFESRHLSKVKNIGDISKGVAYALTKKTLTLPSSQKASHPAKPSTAWASHLVEYILIREGKGQLS